MQQPSAALSKYVPGTEYFIVCVIRAKPLLGHYHAQVSPCVGLAPSLTCVLEKKGTTAALLYTAVLRVLEKKGTTAVLRYTAVL